MSSPHSSSAYAWPSFAAAGPEAEAERAREEAGARGYAEGLTRAETQARARHEALGRSLAELTSRMEALGEAQARAVTDLAFGVARKLLRAELRTNPAVLEALVAEALAALEAGPEHVRVLVNPADHEPLMAAIGREGAGTATWAPKADPSVPPGGVSVCFGVRSVEFDPLGRLESFSDQEMADGHADGPAGDPQPAV